jgi:hypothetical protein
MEFVKKPAFNYTHLKGLRKYIKNTKGFIAGGCFKDIFSGKKLRDVDIFFPTEEDYNKALEIYTKKCKGKKGGLREIYSNDNCTGYRDSKRGINIELIKSIFGNPEDVINQFDFTVVQAAYFNPEGEEPIQFIYHPQFFEHLTLKRLVVNSDNIVKPVSTLNRAFKYAGYGFGLCRESKVTLTKAVIERGVVDDINGDLYFGFD